MVRTKCQNPEYLDKYRGGFSNLLTFATAMGVYPSAMYGAIKSLNDLRNAVAHRLEYIVGSKEVLKLCNAISSGLGRNSDQLKWVLKIARWYLNESKNPSINLRRAIFFIWLFLEFDLSIRAEGLSVYTSITQVLENQGQSGLEVFSEERRFAYELIQRLGKPFKDLQNTILN
jgi:hypothetical protein